MPRAPLDLVDRTALRADCSRCAGLCCVLPAFARSADFALDKPAGRPCPHLADDDRCRVHDRLRDLGFPGCVVFDCFGAGQQLTQVTFAGRNWRDDPGTTRAMAVAFEVLRQLHEMRWLLAEAAERSSGALHVRAVELAAGLAQVAAADADILAALDVAGLRAPVAAVLGEVSETVRHSAPIAGRRRAAADRRGADLAGADLRGADLRGVSLRAALLVGADLRRADLRWADLLGTDLRGADLSGADLSGCLFLTRPQLDAARGSATTVLPDGATRPAHWRH